MHCIMLYGSNIINWPIIVKKGYLYKSFVGFPKKFLRLLCSMLLSLLSLNYQLYFSLDASYWTWQRPLPGLSWSRDGRCWADEAAVLVQNLKTIKIKEWTDQWPRRLRTLTWGEGRPLELRRPTSLGLLTRPLTGVDSREPVTMDWHRALPGRRASCVIN